MIAFQSTHPRGVRLLPDCLRIIQLSTVSIHAPAWGATIKVIFCHYFPPVSIHAPAWGATVSSPKLRAVKRFQSTHPRGVRHHYNPGGTRRDRRFNPRTRVGCDRGVGDRPAKHPHAHLYFAFAFQSTHPRGVRRAPWSLILCYETFQSTHPRGVRRRLLSLRLD